MSPLNFMRYLLLVSLVFNCILISCGKGGRGGGGSRGGGRSSGGGWGRSSSSRSSSSAASRSAASSSSKSSSSSSSLPSKSSHSYGASSGSIQSSANYPRQAYVHKPPSPPATSSFQSISSANYPRQPISSNSFASSQNTFPNVGIPNANYPRQPISSNSFTSSQSLPSQGVNLNANYPLQPFSSNSFQSSSFSQAGIPNANYPRQPISSSSLQTAHGSFLQGGMPHIDYPKQPSSNPFFQSSSSQGGLPSASYPRQPISSNPFFQSSSSQIGIPNTNFPRQPSSNPFFQGPSVQGGVLNSNYPLQPISFNPVKPSHSSTSFGSVPNINYPKLPSQQTSGNFHPQGSATATIPKKVSYLPSPKERSSIPVHPSRTSSFQSQPPKGFASSPNYQRQQAAMFPQVLGNGVWSPKSGTAAPVYMNYGGLPTGANMYTRPLKKKGFLGSLISFGSSSSKPYKNKHYGSYPSPYGMGGGRPSEVMGSFMGNKGSKTAMYTILPYMAARKAPKIFKPKFRFYSYRPIGYYSHGYHSHGHHYSHIHDDEFEKVRYDVYNNDYVGRCNRPIRPDHAKIICNSTHNEVTCGVTCDEGYRFADATTRKSNKCWHAAGVWNPKKNYPACEPVCEEPCLNGGKCASPGVCRCTSEYRGPHCQFHFLNCDIRKLAKGLNIRWVCNHAKNETSCRVKCRFNEFAATSLYKCTPQGVWTPSEMPKCQTPDIE